VRRRLALSALTTLFAAALAVSGNVTTASADSSAPSAAAPQVSSQSDGSSLGWTYPYQASNLDWTYPY
jgi:ABC-type phosphate transport system substrate-binding protein